MTRQKPPIPSRRFDLSAPADRNNGPETVGASSTHQVAPLDQDLKRRPGEPIIGWVIRFTLHRIEQDKAMQEKERQTWLQ